MRDNATKQTLPNLTWGYDANPNASNWGWDTTAFPDQIEKPFFSKINTTAGNRRY